MFDLETKFGIVKIYAETIEDEAIAQIVKMSNSPLGENSHIRIMPDAHAGAGCTIGTTMLITDKVCPNLVGVDIGCGVELIKTDIDIDDRLDELDRTIKENVPSGRLAHDSKQVSPDYFKNLYCWEALSKDTKLLALRSLGTLGGGNHFIEAYMDGFISVHSGSRNIGWRVADYYQKLAAKRFKEKGNTSFKELIKEVPPTEREGFIKSHKSDWEVEKDLLWLEGQDLENYLHDLYIMQEFAEENRSRILQTIIDKMNGKSLMKISSTHNYIDENRILRKGAISAKEDELLVIPMNMRDGLLVCRGKGNEDWNYSAPHGAGRLYSRSKAKELFTVEEFSESMTGIYTTCVSQSTLDEAPFVYKNFEEIIKAIKPTVQIEDRLLPIYNFKANA